ncbi:MAG TPA: hypothetical protein VK281_09210, partial [Xanthobacteraceae bacterium]|nr:hypothetical protein [Xanthobacteraceae bacterium]
GDDDYLSTGPAGWAMLAARLLERLAALYPDAFKQLAPVPLTLRVDRDIKAALSASRYAICAVLTRWTRRVVSLARSCPSCESQRLGSAG